MGSHLRWWFYFPQAVMKELGQKLRDTRERLGITLEEVESATRIRTYHLAALEQGDIEALPSPVQVRGFLGNYAEYLGLESDTILLEYAEKLQSRRPKMRPQNARRRGVHRV